MLSEQRLDLLRVEGNKTIKVSQEGPIAYAESTTQEEIFPEDGNRCIIVSTDETQEQNRRVLAAMAGDQSERVEGLTAVVARHHALQRTLRPYDIVVPFDTRLAQLFPSQRVEARRAFAHLLTVIETVAFLYQQQRERDDRGRLIATAADYLSSGAFDGWPVVRSAR